MWRRTRVDTGLSAALLALLALLCGSAALGAQPGSVLVVASSDDDAYRLAADAIRRSLHQRPVEIVTLDDPLPAEHNVLAVSLGARATGIVARLRMPLPHVAALLSASAYHALFGAQGAPLPAPSAALLVDQPPQRHIEAARQLMPRLDRLGVLLDAETDFTPPDVAGVEIVVRRVGARSNVVRELEALMLDVDGILAVPEPRVYNRRTIHGVLLSAYRNMKPVIGYSRPLVSAGALLSAYTPPELLGEQTARLVEQVLRDGDQARISYPEHYRIAVNAGIARALGATGDAAALQRPVYVNDQRVR